MQGSLFRVDWIGLYFVFGEVYVDFGAVVEWLCFLGGIIIPSGLCDVVCCVMFWGLIWCVFLVS